MIAMTIQGLEVQKMTLSTLQGMNVSMDAVRDALKARSGDATAGAASPSAPPAPPEAAPPTSEATSDATAAQAELINPMRWWDTLTQQFTHLASQTAQTAQSMGEQMMGDAAARKPQAKADRPARKATASRKTSARPRARKAGGSDAG
jgi:hypothetical protein